METDNENANRTSTVGQTSSREAQESIFTAVNSCQSTKIAEECTAVLWQGLELVQLYFL